MDGRIDDSINTTELLMNISKDVAVIKNDMQHFKEDAKENAEKAKEQAESVNKRLTTLESDVSCLKNQDDKKDAHKYRKILTAVVTALSGVVIAKLPDIIEAFLKAFRG